MNTKPITKKNVSNIGIFMIALLFLGLPAIFYLTSIEEISRVVLIILLLMWAVTLAFSSILFDIVSPKKEWSEKPNFAKAWIRFSLRMIEKILSGMSNTVVGGIQLILNTLLIISMFGIITLYLFMLPGGVVNLIATYVFDLSQQYRQDFTTTYATFSTAIVMLVLIVVGMTELIHYLARDFDGKFFAEEEDKKDIDEFRDGIIKDLMIKDATPTP